MNLSNILNRVEGFGFFGRDGAERDAVAELFAAVGSTKRVGDVVVSTGVANDIRTAANDTFGPHMVDRLVELRERLHNHRSA